MNLNKKPFTEKEKKRMKELIKEAEHKTLFICCDCKEKLIGMKNVRKHVNNKQHYEYKNPKHPHGRLLVG